MRTNCIKSGSENLRYEIREIVEIGRVIERLGDFSMIWENIGDPVAKGETIPDWMKSVITKALEHDEVYSYSPTKGILSTRAYIRDHYSRNADICGLEDIIFFNGLGEAINKIFSNLSHETRVIGPNPSYPSHATSESIYHGGKPIFYHLDLYDGARIDLEDLEQKVRHNDSIGGILIINPNNPTGVAHPRADLERVVDIARRYDCFLIFDEIYQNMLFDPTQMTPLSQIVGDVPGIAMKGISKDLPWPGARCGWIEVYNVDQDPNFHRYIETITVSKMLEVCSTTLPQVVFPEIREHPEYERFFSSRLEKYRSRLDQALQIFSGVSELAPIPPDGVFYLTIPFARELQGKRGSPLHARTKEIRQYLDEIETEAIRTDKYFAYELMGSEGVCVVPLSGFHSQIDGFRMTLLEEDEQKFIDTCHRIVRAVRQFFA